MTTQKQARWLKKGYVLLAGLLLTGASMTIAESAPILPLVDFCAMGAPDASSILGPNDQSDEHYSMGVQYAYKQFCPRLVVDFFVPWNSSSPDPHATERIFFGVSPANSLWEQSKATCESTEIHETLYKKIGKKLKKIAGGVRKGQWTSSPFLPCMLAPAPGHKPFPVIKPPLRGTAQYRVTAKIETYGLPMPVKVSAEHEIIPW